MQVIRGKKIGKKIRKKKKERERISDQSKIITLFSSGLGWMQNILVTGLGVDITLHNVQLSFCGPSEDNNGMLEKLCMET